MKVKTLIDFLIKCRAEYPDLDDWDVFTEQPNLCVPEHHLTMEQEKKRLEDEAVVFNQPFNQEYWNELVKSDKEITKLKDSGWDILTDSEGWVFRSIAAVSDNLGHEYPNCTVFEKERVITINNNY